GCARRASSAATSTRPSWSTAPPSSAAPSWWSSRRRARRASPTDARAPPSGRDRAMTPPDAVPPAADATCDGGDLDCGSGLLLIIRSAMAPLPPGGVLLVKSREASVREDLPAWCRMVGHTLCAEQDADGGYRHYWLRKKADDSALGKDLQAAREHVWQTRVRWAGGMLAKAGVRNHALAVGQPASFD